MLYDIGHRAGAHIAIHGFQAHIPATMGKEALLQRLCFAANMLLPDPHGRACYRPRSVRPEICEQLFYDNQRSILRPISHPGRLFALYIEQLVLEAGSSSSLERDEGDGARRIGCPSRR